MHSGTLLEKNKNSKAFSHNNTECLLSIISGMYQWDRQKFRGAKTDTIEFLNLQC